MRKRQPETVLEVALARGGYRKGIRVATYIAQWTIAQRDLGHAPSVDEAADWWKEPRRTWFRYQSEFREVFHELRTPAPIAERVIAEQADQLDSAPAAVAYLGRVPASLLPA